MIEQRSLSFLLKRNDKDLWSYSFQRTLSFLLKRNDRVRKTQTHAKQAEQ